MKTATPTAQAGVAHEVSPTDGPGDRAGAGSVEANTLRSASPATSTITLPGGGVLDSRRLPGTVEVRIVGEVDMFDRQTFKGAFAALESEPVPFLYVLADAATFIESSCLDAMAQTAAVRARAGGSTVVSGLREPFATAWSLATLRCADEPPAPLVGR